MKRNYRTLPGCRAIRIAVLLASPAVLLTAGPVEPGGQSLCGQVPAITKELAAITGLQLHRPVPCDFITREKVNQYLQKRIKEVAKPEEIRAEELTLKKFGLVPADFDLARNTVDLLTEQAAAFYDYEKRKLFITESTPSETQEPVLAHELAHALADQNFGLARYIKGGRKSDDGAAARLAVMEGQATWIMSEYLARRLGQSLETTPGLVETMSSVSESGAGQFPVFDRVPLYMRRTLVFPYTKGMLFQNAILKRDGKKGFAGVFERAPISTQQIIHPEKYFGGVKPTEPALPSPALPRAYKSLIGGSLGELDIAILLEQYVGKERAARIAPAWRGFAFELREDRKAGRVVLLHAAEWESEEGAQAYFAAYREALGKKWKAMNVASEDAESMAGTGDDGRFELRRKGSIVTCVEGLDPALH